MHNKTRHLGYIVQFFKRAETPKSVKSPQNAVKTRKSFLDFYSHNIPASFVSAGNGEACLFKAKNGFSFLIYVHRAKNKSASKPDFCSETKIFS